MKRIVLWIIFFLSLALGLYLRSYYAGDCYDVEGDKDNTSVIVYQVEADAYARLARVQRILNGQGLIQRFHPQENYPHGIQSTTTFPLDFLILALYAPARFFTSHPLDWAGALVSPAIYLALVAFLFWWSRNRPMRARIFLLLGAAVLPGMVWATAFARPDHQSLNLALVGAALCLEWFRWAPDTEPKKRFAFHKFSVAAGILWGLAMWTSLYEPLLLFTALVVFNFAVRRREQLDFFITTAIVLALAFGVEGFRLQRTPPELDAYLVRWFGTIGELKEMTPRSASIYFTPVFWLLPFFAIRLLQCGERKPVDWLVIFLSTVLSVIAFLQSRWLYFTAFALLLLWMLWYERERIAWLRRVVLGVMIFSVAWSLDYDLNAIDNQERRPFAQLRQLSPLINGQGGILAPWWLSSSLLYYSGQPIVSGSSHMAIAGTVDSARFFTTVSWVEGDRILTDRQVRWVLVYDPERLLLNSRQILGTTSSDLERVVPHQTLAERLYDVYAVPTRFHLRGVTKDCKLYEYVPSP